MLNNHTSEITVRIANGSSLSIQNIKTSNIIAVLDLIKKWLIEENTFHQLRQIWLCKQSSKANKPKYIRFKKTKDAINKEIPNSKDQQLFWRIVEIIFQLKATGTSPMYTLSKMSKAEIKFADENYTLILTPQATSHKSRKMAVNVCSSIVSALTALLSTALIVYSANYFFQCIQYPGLFSNASLFISLGLLGWGIHGLSHLLSNFLNRYRKEWRYNVNLTSSIWQYVLWGLSFSMVGIGVTLNLLKTSMVLPTIKLFGSNLMLSGHWMAYAIVTGFLLIMAHKAYMVVSETLMRIEYLFNQPRKTFVLGVARFLGVTIGLGTLGTGLYLLIMCQANIFVNIAAIVAPLSAILWILGVRKEYNLISMNCGIFGLIASLVFSYLGLIGEICSIATHIVPIVLLSMILGSFVLFGLIGTSIHFYSAQKKNSPCLFGTLFGSITPTLEKNTAEQIKERPSVLPELLFDKNYSGIIGSIGSNKDSDKNKGCFKTFGVVEPVSPQ